MFLDECQTVYLYCIVTRNKPYLISNTDKDMFQDCKRKAFQLTGHRPDLPHWRVREVLVVESEA